MVKTKQMQGKNRGDNPKKDVPYTLAPFFNLRKPYDKKKYRLDLQYQETKLNNGICSAITLKPTLQPPSRLSGVAKPSSL